MPAINTEDGVRAIAKEKPVEPAGVEKYLEGKFGDALEPVRHEMRALAKAFDRSNSRLSRSGCTEVSGPWFPRDASGWGAKVLGSWSDRSLAEKR